MAFNERIRKLCRICGDLGSINIFGSVGQSLYLSEKINTMLPIDVRIYHSYISKNNNYLLQYILNIL